MAPQELQAMQDKVTRMANTEIALREQLAKYTDSYDEFQRTVESSNTIMNKFKKEMESVSHLKPMICLLTVLQYKQMSRSFNLQNYL